MTQDRGSGDSGLAKESSRPGFLTSLSEGNPLAWVGLAMAGVALLTGFLISNGTIQPARRTGAGQQMANTRHSNAALGESGKSHSLSLISKAHAASVPPQVIKMGERLFKENCEVCHQADAIGKPGWHLP